MQPTIIFTAPIPGMIYLNGHFAGEASGDHPLYAPVSPFGAAYIEYRPLAPGYPPAAMKCVFSGGEIMADSIAGSGSISAVSWPGYILEMEFTPAKHTIESFYLNDIPCTFEQAEQTVLRMGGIMLNLPESTMRPDSLVRTPCPVIMGNLSGGGRYMISLSPDLSVQTGMIAADHIEPQGELFHCIAFSGDIVGHGRLEQWMADMHGLHRISSESIWKEGGPAWPQTPENTVRAAVEAALIGLWDEAENYFAPSIRHTSPLNAISDICDLCVEMKYGMPGSQPCVGLLRVVNDCFARVSPLFYQASPGGGPQGPWQIDWVSMEQNT